MNCPSGCRCKRHNEGPALRVKNTTFQPDRRHESSTYGEQQRERMRLVNADREARGITFNDRPSTRFDWDRAIAGLRRILAEVYGQE